VDYTTKGKLQMGGFFNSEEDMSAALLDHLLNYLLQLFGAGSRFKTVPPQAGKGAKKNFRPGRTNI